MGLKNFLIISISIYVLISLPAILGIGYVIDWIPEATLFQKLKGYVIGGLLYKFLIKVIIAFIAGIIVSLILSLRRQ
ncbi:hypothetical protein [Oceanobacillus salinisoli]|uniref:hypothetical protein n=1 Tax=Oceanobacillus salinisoli TaxID=2678611 RepID=UPI0012E110F8|nr:hypothetical protein [Oceanobacillus salinisoli]